MDIKTLDDKIKAKADELTQKEIGLCAKAIQEAVKRLLGFTCAANLRDNDEKQVLMILCGEKPSNAWPTRIWTYREDQLRNEILSTMDTLQRVLLTKPREPGPDDPRPCQKETT